jgi:hypothetical protein
MSPTGHIQTHASQQPALFDDLSRAESDKGPGAKPLRSKKQTRPTPSTAAHLRPNTLTTSGVSTTTCGGMAW